MTSRQFNAYEIEAFQPDNKVALIATVDPDNAPHTTLITSLQAKSSDELMFGQFSAGRSKTHLTSNPKVGFLIMNQKRQLWRGKANWTHCVGEGQDFVLYNNKPMFRYNAYFGIHAVHYLDLVEHTGQKSLPVLGLAAGTLISQGLKRLTRSKPTEPVMKPWAVDHISKPTTLKFLSFVAADGYPEILPLVPCHATDSVHVCFTPTVHHRRLRGLSRGTEVAVFALNLKMESVLVRGRFAGFRPFDRIGIGVIDINWVYNSMPPMHGQIYPTQRMRPVTAF